jgi:hypothetical protein
VHPLFLQPNDDSHRDFINPQNNFTENIADATATAQNVDERSDQLSQADDGLSSHRL